MLCLFASYSIPILELSCDLTNGYMYRSLAGPLSVRLTVNEIFDYFLHSAAKQHIHLAPRSELASAVRACMIDSVASGIGAHQFESREPWAQVRHWVNNTTHGHNYKKLVANALRRLARINVKSKTTDWVHRDNKIKSFVRSLPKQKSENENGHAFIHDIYWKLQKLLNHFK